MSKAAKIKNLYRLDVKNGTFIIIYLFKRILRMRISAREKEVYQYYNFLIKYNGKLISESEDCFIGFFEGRIKKRIILRRNPSSDLEVFNQVFINNVYGPLIDSFLSNRYSSPKKNITIIDCGANIGLSPLFFFLKFPQSRIICVEPEPSNLDVMDFNLPSSETFSIIRGGIWSHDVALQICRDFRDHKEWSARVKVSKEDHLNTMGHSIKNIMEKYQINEIDILKIDIEGAEKEVFLSKNANLDFLNITRCLAIEIHDEFQCRDEIYEILNAFDFSFFNHGELTIGLNNKLQ